MLQRQGGTAARVLASLRGTWLDKPGSEPCVDRGSKEAKEEKSRWQRIDKSIISSENRDYSMALCMLFCAESSGVVLIRFTVQNASAAAAAALRDSLAFVTKA